MSTVTISSRFIHHRNNGYSQYRRLVGKDLQLSNHRQDPSLYCPFKLCNTFMHGMYTDPPKPPILKNVKKCYKAIKITWEIPPNHQDTPTTGYVLSIKEESAKSTALKEISFPAKSNYFIVTNLSEGNSYRVWLYAVNVAGRSNASKKEHVQMLQEGE